MGISPTISVLSRHARIPGDSLLRFPPFDDAEKSMGLHSGPRKTRRSQTKQSSEQIMRIR